MTDPTAVRRRRARLATIVPCLTFATVIWPLAYEELALLSAPPYPSWLVGTTIAGVLAGLLLRGSTTYAILAILLGFAGSLPIRALFVIISGSQAHHLTPEAMIAAAVGVFGGLVGVGLTRVNPGFWPTGG